MQAQDSPLGKAVDDGERPKGWGLPIGVGRIVQEGVEKRVCVAPDSSPGAWRAVSRPARGSAEGRKPLGRGSGGVPQQNFPFSRAREKGIKGMRVVPGSRKWLSTRALRPVQKYAHSYGLVPRYLPHSAGDKPQPYNFGRSPEDRLTIPKMVA